MRIKWFLCKHTHPRKTFNSGKQCAYCKKMLTVMVKRRNICLLTRQFVRFDFKSHRVHSIVSHFNSILYRLIVIFLNILFMLIFFYIILVYIFLYQAMDKKQTFFYYILTRKIIFILENNNRELID